VLLALVWGLSWPMMRIALQEVGVFTLRAAGFSISTLFLFALIRLQGRSAIVPRGRAWAHIAISSLINVVAFALFSSFAVLVGSTARAVIVNYSMPVWATLMAWLVLGERPDRPAVIGLALCIGGLATLVYPIASTQAATGLLLALGCSLSWAAGTIYMKWARMHDDLLVITAWQIALAAAIFLIVLPFSPPMATSGPVSTVAILAVVYNGLLGTGVAYILWFAIVARLPTTTASLGALATPVVGIISSIAILGERPTIEDAIGFALILAAAACVLIPRPTPPTVAL
jgi:drug/metabolite transporter (DMT)-like permease